jgi:hypothetical protein
MVNLSKKFKELCTPAMIYFVISVVAILVALLNHIKMEAVLIKAVFVLFWTYILNFLCKKGYKSVSWFLVLFPYILLLAAGFGVIHEGFTEGATPAKPADKPKPAAKTPTPAPKKTSNKK